MGKRGKMRRSRKITLIAITATIVYYGGPELWDISLALLWEFSHK